MKWCSARLCVTARVAVTAVSWYVPIHKSYKQVEFLKLLDLQRKYEAQILSTEKDKHAENVKEEHDICVWQLYVLFTMIVES